MEDRLSEILSVNCPACGHGMNIQRKHLGIRGKCVSCGDPLVAAERPGIGVIAMNPEAPQASPHAAEPSPGFSPIGTGREQTGGAAHHSPSEQAAVSQAPIPFADSPEKSGAPGGTMPEIWDERKETRGAAVDRSTAPSRSRLEEGFASLFKKQPDEEEADGNFVAPPPLSTVPDRNLGGDHPSLLSGGGAVPWTEQPRKSNPFDGSGKPSAPEGLKDPFADRLMNPISRSVKEAAGGFSPTGREPELGGSGAGSWPGSVPIEEPDPGGSSKFGREQPGGGFPGVTVEQLKTGRRNLFVRFLLGLMKLAMTLTVAGGVAVGVYFLTPPETMKKWKDATIEWLQPGLVLREHLPFKVPFLEKLAHEEMIGNGVSKPVTEDAGVSLAPEPETDPAREEALPVSAPEPEGSGEVRPPVTPDTPVVAVPESSEIGADGGDEVAARSRPRPQVPEGSEKGAAGDGGPSLVSGPGNQPAEPAQAVGEKSAAPPQPAPDTVGPPVPAHAMAVASSGVVPPVPAHAAAPAPAKPVTEGEDPAEMLEPMGRVVLTSFYGAQSMEDRRQYLLNPEKYGAAMEAFYARYQALPTVREMVFRGPMRDASSGIWFAVFDVREEQNEELHRWCVVQVEPGILKIDWGLYQQLADRSLERFLSDPASPSKVFRALIHRGEPVVGAENPWGVPAMELFLRTPLDTAQARRIVLPQSECDRLGLTENLLANHARIAELELSWLPGAGDPSQRFPGITGVFFWGAW